jgi:hypothetical protein
MIKPGRGRSRRAWSHYSGARYVPFGLAAVAIAALLTVMQAPAGAATGANPYRQAGYDASYPSAQCGAGAYPAGFAIIGLGGGRPFTTNACAAHEWVLAPAALLAPSLYFNTGYAGAYTKKITAGCQAAVGHAPIPAGTPRHQKTVEEQAWEIGCSEAAYAAANEPGTPAVWWADVETGNSWSVNTTYNDLAIDGIAYEMSGLSTTTGAGFGFYSTPAMWSRIAGAGFDSNPAATADWQATAACPGLGFSDSPVWLIQTGAVTANGVSFSADQAC